MHISKVKAFALGALCCVASSSFGASECEFRGTARWGGDSDRYSLMFENACGAEIKTKAEYSSIIEMQLKMSDFERQIKEMVESGMIEKAVKEEISNTDVVKKALVEEVAGNSTVLREEVKATIAQERAEKLDSPLADNEIFVKNLDVTKMNGIPVVKLIAFAGSDRQVKPFDCNMGGLEQFAVIDMSADKVATNNANALVSYLLTKYAAGDKVLVNTKKYLLGDDLVCRVDSVS